MSTPDDLERAESSSAMTPSEPDAERVAALEARIRELAVEAQQRAAAKLRRQNLVSVVGVLLAIVCIFSLSAVTRLTKKLDADAVAQIGRAELEAHLPSSRAALQGYLEAEAPRLVSESVQSLLGLLPQIRRLVTESLMVELSAINAEFEQELLFWVETEVVEARELVRRDYPHMDDRQQLEMLVADVSANFSANFAAAIDALYPRYREQMRRITDELVLLQTADPATLDEQQRARKDIIETMLRLILREQEGRS